MRNEIEILISNLKALEARREGNIGVLAAVAGISKNRLHDIMNEKVKPTLIEISTLQMLRGFN